MERQRLASARGLPIVVIGAGLGGVACAVNLRRAGFEDVTVLEKAAGPGGVWWANTYPGCEVDVDSRAYSYSFMPYVWQRTHASQPEMLEYIQEVIQRFGVADMFHYGVTVHEARWDDAEQAYWLDTSRGRLGPFALVVSAVGMLSTPSIPAWGTGSAFTGELYHTTEIDENVSFEGKRVAIVGTGSTACQIAPEIASTAASLYLYQREPAYVLPKRARRFTDAEKARYDGHPLRLKWDRWKLLAQAARDTRAFDAASKKQQKIRDFHASYLEKTVSDPVVRAQLTPDYPYGCKRPVFASGFYRMFSRPNVELVPNAVVSLTEGSIVDESGVSREVDMIVMATGFQATNYLSGLRVIGPNGESLHDAWDGEPSALFGMAVPGFPNFLMMYGPNTNGGWSICAQLERQSEYVVRAARKLARGPALLQATIGATRWYNAWLQRSLARNRSAFSGSCNNYYRTSSGLNVTQWPFGHAAYALIVRIVPLFGMSLRPIRKLSASREVT